MVWPKVAQWNLTDVRVKGPGSEGEWGDADCWEDSEET